MTATIALDAMGGDHGPTVIVPAALRVLEQRSDVRLVLVGDQGAVEQALASHAAFDEGRLTIRHASQHVEMDELPSQALRNKKDSSMRVAIDLVKEDAVGACVSAGNTGALVATARFVLRTLPGVDRPAIISALPAVNGHTHMLDLGANVESTPRQLFEFSVMGAALVSAVDGLERPRVGLLNIGEEEIKGNERVKEAARLIAAGGLNYIGFVEGDDIFKGIADVIVCDGFVGNVALKSSEGVAEMIGFHVKRELDRRLLTRIAALVALSSVRSLRARFDPRNYNGASLLGLKGIVIKSHGGADVDGFANAIRVAIKEIENNVPERIDRQLKASLVEREAV